MEKVVRKVPHHLHPLRPWSRIKFFLMSVFCLQINRIFEKMGDTEKNYLLTYPDSILISEVWFVEMFFTVWGSLKMIDARKIPIGSGSDFDLNEKMHQNAHERGIKWHYDVLTLLRGGGDANLHHPLYFL